MKKYLLTICGLAMIATLASCGNSNKESSEYSSYSQVTTFENDSNEISASEMKEKISKKKEFETEVKKQTTKAVTTKDVTTTIETTVPVQITTTKNITQPPTTQAVTQPPTTIEKTIHFIINTDSNCVHVNPNCSAAKKIEPENYSEIDIPENELSNYSGVYWACGKCTKGYKKELPKDE